jgi:hypothetical protein
MTCWFGAGSGLADDRTDVVVVACQTVCEKGADWLGAKESDPSYVATSTQGFPKVKNVTGNEAVPFTTCALPSVVAVVTLEKATVPVGIPEAELTAAFKTTFCP